MTKKIKIDASIIIINNNREKYLERCLRSCVNQILINKLLEIIFIDNGSSDNSLKIAENFKDSIKIIRNKKNIGISKSSNQGLKIAKGNYFMRVDSDDYLSLTAVDLMVNIMNSNNFSFICADHYRVNVKGYKEKVIRLNNEHNIKNHGAGILFNKKIFLKMGAYNENLKEAEDYEIISKIMKKYNYFYLPVPLYRYYIHNKNISHSGKRKKIIEKINKYL